MSKFVNLEKIILKNNPEINETIIRDYIFENPLVLGLGDLIPLTKEKTQQTGGRIDILMMDNNKTRYEIELQLGTTDPSHIIRTIEYWDIEKKRYPQYDHCAIIIAEEINGRFMNVISLFNGHIPLIAMQVSAYKQNDKIALMFTKIIDRVVLGTDEDDINLEPTDRKYWEKKSTPQMLSLLDALFENIISKEYGLLLKYNKVYIGLSKDGIAKNFISFVPKKNFVWLQIKCDYDEAMKEKLESAGLDVNYNGWQEYQIKINKIYDYTNNKELINELINSAKDRYNF